MATLIEAVTGHPNARIFLVKEHVYDEPDWDVEPLDGTVLVADSGFYILKAKHILPDGTIQDCYIDMSLPERIVDYVYFFEGRSLRLADLRSVPGDVICAVPIDCFGDYELFYSKIDPEVGIQVLREGLAQSPRKHIIAEDLAYILRDERRYKEAAEMFQLAANEGASSYFIYGELAACYSMIGETAKAEKYQLLFDEMDGGRSAALAKRIQAGK